ncbi:hypothetical protein O3M35_005127 [Rhynocoris fuscipes]|uniref:Methylosome subunit pICln n=1 Tax=Rhynocoris fuscipes TaxID=488301 RepID=A0AAW1DH13_9HEMI
MVVISSLPPPEDGIKLEQPCTRVFMNDKELGKGVVYIAESRLSWVDSSTGRGFSLEYPHISIHAVSRDLQTYPHQCLYLMVDTNIDFSEPSDSNNVDEGENEEEDEITEIRFVPDDHQVLDAMFAAMNDCQALHPDPNDSLSPEEDFDEEGEYEDDDDDEFVDANGDFTTKNGDHVKMEVEGQFDDAEEAESGFVDQD